MSPDFFGDEAVTRRRVLGGGLGLAGIVALSQLPAEAADATTPRLSGYPFTLGVASGDPWPHGVVL